MWVAIVGPGIFQANSRAKWLLRNGFCEMPRCISTVQAQVWVTIVGLRNFHVNSRTNGFCEMSRCISTEQAPTKCGPRSWPMAFYL